MSSGIYYPGANADDGYWYTGYFYPGDNYVVFGKQDALDRHSWWRFLSVAIEKKSVIESAIVRFTCHVSRTDDMLLKIEGNDIDNAVAPTNESEADALVKTSAALDWDITTNWIDGTQYDTVDITAIIQEIVNRGGWASGNALMVLVDNDGGADFNLQAPSAFEYSSGAEKAELHISWGPPPAGGALFFGMNF